MDIVTKSAAVYLFLLIVFRMVGRRTLASLTTFDLVVVLLVSETTQGALVGGDRSFSGAALAILTLMGLDVLLVYVKRRAPAAEKWLDGIPTVLVRDGQPDLHAMRMARVDREDVLAAARRHGLGRLDDISFAILEAGGAISVIPTRSTTLPTGSSALPA